MYQFQMTTIFVCSFFLIAILCLKVILRRQARKEKEAANEELHQQRVNRRRLEAHAKSVRLHARIEEAKKTSSQRMQFHILRFMTEDDTNHLSDADYLWRYQRLAELTPRLTAEFLHQARNGSVEAMRVLDSLTQRGQLYDDSLYYRYTGKHFVEPPDWQVLMDTLVTSRV